MTTYTLSTYEGSTQAEFTHDQMAHSTFMQWVRSFPYRRQHATAEVPELKELGDTLLIKDKNGFLLGKARRTSINPQHYEVHDYRHSAIIYPLFDLDLVVDELRVVEEGLR